MDHVLQDFITMWVVIDPIGTVPVFVVAAAGLSAAARRAMAIRATLIAAAILLAFVIVGQVLIETLGISLPAFQIAGGLILFIFAMTMTFGSSKPEEEMTAAKRTQDDPAVFPLAMPSLASPGAIMAAVVLTDNNRQALVEQAVTTAAMLGVLAIALLFMLLASPIVRLLGNGGTAILSRVMGLILAAVAVQNVLAGARDYFFTATSG
ncbi:MAG: MarC family protein [Planctomycetota bacterium]